MIATAGQRIRAVAAAVAKWERETERKIERRTRPALTRWGRRVHAGSIRWSQRVKASLRGLGRWSGRRLRPVGARLFRSLAALDAWIRKAGAWAVRAATQGSAVLTPERAICAVVLAAAACLVASQFVDYRSVEVGQPGYEGLPDLAQAPTVGVKTAGSAHAYLLIPLAIAAACLSVLALRPGRRRLGRAVCGLGIVSLATILLVDLPAGLDAGAQAAKFSGATAVLENGFYAELVASAAIALGGLLLALDPVRPRKRAARAQRDRRDKGASGREQEGHFKTPPDDGLQRPAIVPRRA